MSFLSAVLNYPFMQYALLACLLASVACGVMGTFVVVRRITYIAGAIAHCVLGGIGCARFLQVVYDIQWFTPMLGAIISALIAALVIGYVSLNIKEREDTIIGAVWAVGMALGILFISQTPGYAEDIMMYLFGNILMVGKGDLFVIGILNLIILFFVILFYRPFLAICFDEEFAKIRNLSVQLYYFLLLILVALTVVLLVSVVGIVMVIALITIPAAISGRFTTKLSTMMIISVLLSVVFTVSGLSLSYSLNLPTGPVIILVLSIVYIFVLIISGKIKRAG